MPALRDPLLRVLDANLNRCREGLRVAEDIARFVLESRPLQAEIKEVRHRLVALFPLAAGPGDARTEVALDRLRLIDRGRDSETDIGRTSFTEGERERQGLDAIAQANLARAEEAARVLEELGKMRSTTLAQEMKRVRFRIYALEKKLLAALAPLMKRQRLRRLGLYGIIDAVMIGNRNLLRVAEEMVRGGARLIQYRDKISEDRPFCAACERLTAFLSGRDVLFIVNDRIDVAAAVDADGVHLGQDDLPVRAAREILDNTKIVGKSTHSLAQAMRAVREKPDYIAVGPILATTTKPDAHPVGCALLKRVRQSVSVPIVAIGGITLGNVRTVMRCQPDAVAAVSAILAAPSVREATRAFVMATRKKIASRRRP